MSQGGKDELLAFGELERRWALQLRTEETALFESTIALDRTTVVKVSYNLTSLLYRRDKRLRSGGTQWRCSANALKSDMPSWRRVIRTRAQQISTCRASKSTRCLRFPRRTCRKPFFGTDFRWRYLSAQGFRWGKQRSPCR